MIGWAMTNTTKIVAPLWGAEKMLGTNPLAIAFPGLEEPPIVLTWRRRPSLRESRNGHADQQAVPDGWVVDKEGRPTTDPRAMMTAAPMLPLGADREHGGHKGYGLAAMVDILLCVLERCQLGSVYAAIYARHAAPAQRRSRDRPLLRRDANRRVHRQREFKHQIDDWSQLFREPNPLPTNRPSDPGDPEREAD